jgi:hypothetical protein
MPTCDREIARCSDGSSTGSGGGIGEAGEAGDATGGNGTAGFSPGGFTGGSGTFGAGAASGGVTGATAGAAGRAGSAGTGGTAVVPPPGETPSKGKSYCNCRVVGQRAPLSTFSVWIAVGALLELGRRRHGRRRS